MRARPPADTKRAAGAHRAVLDRLHPDFRYAVQELIEKLEFEHEEWGYATKNIDWYTQDTLFFKLTRPSTTTRGPRAAALPARFFYSTVDCDAGRQTYRPRPPPGESRSDVRLE
ncbi:hypothetical protein ABZ446_25740 [Streptomyces sp. NPDC005813]|uniref:DUF7691 family protein n=1 Tax=Streptomyces sp. NPDC005813 TaxID=3155592 RepID=UPI003400E754